MAGHVRLDPRPRSSGQDLLPGDWESRPPTPREGRDGTPRPYEEVLGVYPLTRPRPIGIPDPGSSVIVSWVGDNLFTQTADIVAVSTRPAWGGGFRLADPDGVDGTGGVVMAAGRPTLRSNTLMGAFVAAAILTIGEAEAPIATAIGAAVAGDANPSQLWTSAEMIPGLAPVGDDGWRRPWHSPALDRP